MNGTTLKAVRLSLGYSQQEAADLIGQVKERTWRYWEDENRKIPNDVSATMRELVNFKWRLVKQASDQISELVKAHGEPETLHLTYYTNLDAWMTQDGATGIEWRPHCMAMSAIAEKFKFVRLIRFDPIAYREWLGKIADNSAKRAEWAGLQEN